MGQGVAVCAGCGWREPVHSFEDDTAMRVLFPVGRSGYAIVAGYLGLLSPLMIFAPFALLFGILALREIKRKPKLGGKGRAIFGIVMGVIFTLFLLVGVIAVVAAAISER